MSTIVSEDYTVVNVLHDACEICRQLIFSAIGESRLIGNPFVAKQLHGRDARGVFSVTHEAVVIKTALHENYMKVTLRGLKKGLLRGIQNCV